MSAANKPEARSGRLTPKQRESVRRFFARVQAVNPVIKHLWIADSEFHSEFKAPGSDLMNGQGGRQVPVCFRLPQSDHWRDDRAFLPQGRASFRRARSAWGSTHD